MHDMSFWQGKYYLYFGVAPVLLLFLPVRLLTGYFVSEPAAVALFVSLGVAFSCLALVELRARLFPRAGRLVLGCLLAAQGLAAPTVLLVQSPQFYQVPTSCAYALGMAGLWCLLRLLTTGPDRRGRWLVAAGACFGATLAARPNYILAMGLLAVPLWWCWRDAGLLHAPAREKMPLGVRIFGPVAAVGAGLLIFSSPGRASCISPRWAGNTSGRTSGNMCGEKSGGSPIFPFSISAPTRPTGCCVTCR
jgi:hypothetical protein